MVSRRIAIRHGVQAALRPLVRLFRLLDRWNARMAERRYLAHLQERERRDAGINSYDVEWERRKPFWRE